MTKLSFSISRALLLGALLILPIAASAQAPVDEKQAQAERDWYAACNPATDKQKCYEQSKALVASYPNTTYAKYCKAKIDEKEINDLWVPFKAAVDAFYAGQDGPKLEKLYTTGDAFLQRSPGFSWAIAQQALAGNGLVLQEIYKDRAKVKSYIQKGMDHFASPNTPDAKAMDQAQWANFRETIMASGYEVFAFDALESNPAAALDFINKGIQIRSANPANANFGWRNPNFYLFRTQINNVHYVKLSNQYSAMTNEQKVGDEGKEVLKQVGTVIDKLIADYARAMAAANTADYKETKEDTKKRFDQLWEYRTGAPDKAAAYLQGYTADPTLADAAVPAKPETTAPPEGIPQAGTNIKVNAGTKGAPGANGSKEKTPPKGKPAPKGRKRR